MEGLKKVLNTWKMPILTFLVGILISVVIGSMVMPMSCIIIKKVVRNDCMPVRLAGAPVGSVYEDGDAGAIFRTKNYSDEEQVVYQLNLSTGEYQTFDIKGVYLIDGNEAGTEVKNNVVKIASSEEKRIYIEAMSKSDSNIYSTRTSPNVGIVTLQQYQSY